MKKKLSSSSLSERIREVQKMDSADMINHLRHKDHFYGHNVLQAYPKLNFIASRFSFDVSEIIKSFLENLYDENKVGEYLIEIKQFVIKYDMPQMNLAMISPTILQYMKRHNMIDSVIEQVVDMLYGFAAVQMLNNVFLEKGELFDLNVFFISKNNRVAFCSRPAIEEKIKKEVSKYDAEWESKPNFLIFKKHATETLFLMNAETNFQVEEIYSTYYSVFLGNKMIPKNV